MTVWINYNTLPKYQWGLNGKQQGAFNICFHSDVKWTGCWGFWLQKMKESVQTTPGTQETRFNLLLCQFKMETGPSHSTGDYHNHEALAILSWTSSLSLTTKSTARTFLSKMLSRSTCCCEDFVATNWSFLPWRRVSCPKFSNHLKWLLHIEGNSSITKGRQLGGMGTTWAEQGQYTCSFPAFQSCLSMKESKTTHCSIALMHWEGFNLYCGPSASVWLM